MAGLPKELAAVPTGRHGLPADIVAAHQRERLIAATIEVVAKRGYRGTSIDHILKTAKVGYVAFYELFEGKEDCFLASFDRIVEDAVRLLSRAIDPEAPWPEQICSGLQALIAAIVSDPQRARVGLVEVQAAGPVAFSRYEAALDAGLPKLREGRELSAEAAALSPSLEEAIIGGVIWVVHQRLVTAKADEIEALLPETIEITLSPYLGESEARCLAQTYLPA